VADEDDQCGQGRHQQQAGRGVRHHVDHEAACGRALRHGSEPTDGAYIRNKEVSVAYLVLLLVLAGLIYVGWRLMRANASRPRRRVIGPDDDPDFLRRLRDGDNPRP
jgi:hypothetical protein